MKALFVLLIGAGLAVAAPGEKFPPVPPERVAKIESAAPSAAPAKPAKPRRLLVFYRTEGFVHGSIPYGIEALRAVGKKSGAFEIEASDDMAMFTPENLAKFDGVLFLNSTGLKFSDPANRKALMDFVASGKGVMGIHAATDNFPDWPEGRELIGGVFDGHPWGAGDTSAVKNDDPGHPLNAAFGGKGFWIKDEIYQIGGPYGRDKQRVLLSLDMAQPRNARPGAKLRADNDFPISWIKTLPSGGRVFYCSLGHNEDIYETPEVLRHYLAGIQFALGDLKVDSAPAVARPVGAGAGLTLQERPRFSDLDALLAKVATYDFGQSRDAVNAVTYLVRNGSAEERGQIELAILPYLAKAETTYAAKDEICRWLCLVGSDRAVEPLKGLFADDKLGFMALGALFEMRTPAAIAALRLGLESSSTAIRISSVGALGRLRDADSVPVFERLAVSKNPEEARAGLLALGAVGSVESLAALRKVSGEDSQKVARSWAIVAAASNVSGPDAVEAFRTLVSPSEPLGVRLAAIRGLFPLDANVALELYLNLIREGDEGTRARAAGIAKVLPDSAFGPLARMFPDIAPETAAIFLNSLPDRASVRPILLEALGDKRPAVQVATLRGLRKYGNASDVPPLLALAASDGEVGKGAIAALKAVPGADDLLREKLAKADGAERVQLLDILADRRDRGTFSLAISAASDGDPKVRLAGFQAVGPLAKDGDLNAVLGLLAGAKTPKEKSELEKTIVAAVRAQKDADAVTEALSQALEKLGNQRALLVALAAQGTPKARAALLAAVAKATGEQRKEIIRVASGARNEVAAAVLFDIASNGGDASEHTLAMRGLMDYLGEADLSPSRRAGLYLAAYGIANSKEEQDGVVDRLNKMDNGESHDALRKLEAKQAGELKLEGAAFSTFGDAKREVKGVVGFWRIRPNEGGIYTVEAVPEKKEGEEKGAKKYKVALGNLAIDFTLPEGNGDKPVAVGEVSLDGGAECTVSVRAESGNDSLAKLRSIRLTHRAPATAPADAKPTTP